MPSKPRPEAIRDEILSLFRLRGDSLYGGEAVTQTEHALQCAHQAELADASPKMVVAALLHDVGHLLHAYGDSCAATGLDDRHEELGADWLGHRFGPDVCEPIRLHVLAKRFLCSIDQTYLERLSPPSRLSFKLQGGQLKDLEAERFRANEYGEAAVQLRHWDDAAKVPGLATPKLDHFLAIVAEVLDDED